MDPNKISGPVYLRDLSCKGRVGAFVVRVVGIGRRIFGSNILPEQVMEQWPQDYDVVSVGL